MPIKLSTAINLPLFMVLSSDHRTGATGKTLAISISKNGAVFAAVTPVVTELTNGWYNVAFTSTHTNTLGAFAVHVTAAACDNLDELFDVTSYDYATSGARTVTVNVKSDSAVNIEGARVRFSQSGNTRDVRTTNSSGNATITVDDGAYTVGVTADGFDGESQSYSISANDQILSVILTSNAPTAPSDPDQITVYGYTRAGSGEGVPATITFRLRVPADEAGSIYIGQPIQTTSSTLGYFEIDLLRSSQYDVSVDGSGKHVRITTTDAGSMEMPLAVC